MLKTIGHRIDKIEKRLFGSGGLFTGQFCRKLMRFCHQFLDKNQSCIFTDWLRSMESGEKSGDDDLRERLLRYDKEGLVYDCETGEYLTPRNSDVGGRAKTLDADEAIDRFVHILQTYGSTRVGTDN